MLSALPQFANARVLVVGDLMLDRYWHGATARISPEAPVPVVQVRDARTSARAALPMLLPTSRYSASIPSWPASSARIPKAPA